jgi:MraZ protein
VGDGSNLALPATPVEAPIGFQPTRVDEKGRLKFPSNIGQYLSDLGEKKVFVTTLDVVTIRIYPMLVWRATQALLEAPADDSEIRDDVAFVAYHYGADSEIDPQGRILVPTNLRRELNVENAQVHLRCFKSRIDLFPGPAYDKMLADAKASLVSKVKALEKLGLR